MKTADIGKTLIGAFIIFPVGGALILWPHESVLLVIIGMCLAIMVAFSHMLGEEIVDWIERRH